MLMLAGRLGILALGLALLLGAVPRLAGDEVPEIVPSPAVRPYQIPSSTPPAAESSGAPAAEDVVETRAKPATGDSHRRRTPEPQASGKSSRRSHGGLTAVTELPIERLRQRLSADVNVAVPPASRSTLTEVMRRLAGWSDSCPLCGKSCPLCGRPGSEHDEDLADAVVPPKPSPADRQTLGYVGQEESDDEALSRPLRAGEPAQVILDTQRRLGKSVLDGTEFGGSPELLIQWIRALDEENRRQQAMLEEVSRADVDQVDDGPGVTGASQIESLRNACRQLQEAADLLEEQNLFESADSVRRVADALRRQAREKVGDQPTSELEARRPSSASAAEPEGDE